MRRDRLWEATQNSHPFPEAMRHTSFAVRMRVNEIDNGSREFFRLLEVHDMTSYWNYCSSSAGNTRLDGSGVGMNVRMVGAPRRISVGTLISPKRVRAGLGVST